MACPRDGRPPPVALAAVAIVTALAFHSWPLVRAGHMNALELYTVNTKKSAPPRAVILGTGDYGLVFLSLRRRSQPAPGRDVHRSALAQLRLVRQAYRELGAPVSVAEQ